VVGQGLLERGFRRKFPTRRWSSSESGEKGIDPADYEYLDRKLMALLTQAREAEPALGSSGSIITSRDHCSRLISRVSMETGRPL